MCLNKNLARGTYFNICVYEEFAEPTEGAKNEFDAFSVLTCVVYIGYFTHIFFLILGSCERFQ